MKPRSKLVLGTINQGGAYPEYEFSAYNQNTIFLSSVCSADDYLDLPAQEPSLRAELKNIGSLIMTITNIVCIDENRFAELEMDDNSKDKYKKITDLLFSADKDDYSDQTPKIMTLSPMTTLRVGDQLGVGYISVLEVMGEGNYRLKHDYPIERIQGPRYEKFQDNK
jgi:hypothetical protein